jgi:ubiquinone/menaquinone biosynthesis C-methylase UbiE
MNAPCMVNPSSGVDARTKNAWTAFWQEPGQSHCLSGAPDLDPALADHWSAFALSLAPGSRVLDLGCGAGAVGRQLSSARDDVHITGIDFARIPLAIDRQVELLSDTAMECMPFADGTFDAVVSQFGYEYSQTERTAREMARVLGPNARVSLLVHHAGSSIVATNRARLDALVALLGQTTLHSAFCSGDAHAFDAQMSALVKRHSRDAVIAALARSLPLRMGRAARERAAIWSVIEDALAPERCLSEALQACCVAPEGLDDWLGPLRKSCDLDSPSVLCGPNGEPIAWRISGRR